MYRITWSTRKSKGKVKYYALFRSYTTTGNEKGFKTKGRGTIDLKSSVSSPSELQATARMLKCEVTEGKGWIKVERDDHYFRLVTYAVVRMTVKKPAKVDKLRELVIDEGFNTDAWWWANTFINRFKSDGMTKGVGIRCLYKPAKAFKLVYNLD
jgi:hypothetical protein